MYVSHALRWACVASEPEGLNTFFFPPVADIRCYWTRNIRDMSKTGMTGRPLRHQTPPHLDV